MNSKSLTVLAKSIGSLVGQTVFESRAFGSVETSPEEYTKDLVDATVRAYGLSSEEEDRLVDLVEAEAGNFATDIVARMNRKKGLN